MEDSNEIVKQLAELNDIELDIGALKNKLLTYQNNINSMWASNEMRYVNSEIDAIRDKLEEVAKDAEKLYSDLSEAPEGGKMK